MATITKTIEVNTEALIKAVEFACSSAYTGNKEQNQWMFFSGIFCLDFFHEEERPSHKDLEDYDEFLKLMDLEDSHEAYYSYICNTKEYWESLLLDTIGDIEVEYI